MWLRGDGDIALTITPSPHHSITPLLERLRAAPGRRDLFRRLAAELVRPNRQRLADLAAGEHLERAHGPLHEAALAQELRRHDRAGLEPRAERVEVHDVVLDAERVVEAALGHAPVQRHLAAFEPALVVKARARFRALVAAPGRLAVARALAAPDALLRMFHALGRAEIM